MVQEAKDQVAKIHYSDKWDKIDWYHLNEINERTEPPYMEEILMKEVAELYARSKTEQVLFNYRNRLLEAQLMNDGILTITDITTCFAQTKEQFGLTEESDG